LNSGIDLSAKTLTIKTKPRSIVHAIFSNASYCAPNNSNSEAAASSPPLSCDFSASAATFPPDETANVPWRRNQWFKGYTDGFATTSPVGSFPANAYGLFEMGSNVAQWREDYFDDSRKERVQRGASWEDTDRTVLQSSRRYHSPSTWMGYRFGFRCALELPEK
jgi:formylglycine-generating enzyme required for sulfatase activity